MKVGSILPVDDFCGSTFSTEKGGVLTVVGIVGKSGGDKKYALTCSVCHLDSEMFPDYFESTKGSLVYGSVPCGCAKSPRLNERQIIIKINRKCKERNLKFIGFVDGYFVKAISTKLILECPTHGVWDSTTYNNFNNGRRGCPSCGGSKKLTQEEAILNIQKICKEKNYKFITFVDGSFDGAYKTKLILQCPIHGEWDSTNYCDFTKENGTGCPSCGFESRKGKQKLSEEEAIANIQIKCKERNLKFIAFVGGYYINWKTKLILSCPIHGEWDSANYNRFTRENGSGCPSCGIESTIESHKLSEEEATIKIQKVCTEKNYKFISFVGGSYVNNETKLILECPIHGEWDSTTYASFTKENGSGCSCCAKTGYDKSKPGYLYIYKYKFKHLPVVYKFGITNRTPQKRSKEHIQFKEHLVEHQECVFKKKWENGLIPDKIESLLCQKYKGVCDWLTSGNTETFNESDYQDVLNIINNFKEE